MGNALTRIGVFYDGNFFHVVSEYFEHHHVRRARLSVRGLHALLCARVATEEGVSQRGCRVVEAHYFRGRFSAEEAQMAGKLLSERQLEDALMREGVATHFLPMGSAGTEKGIDVWFALEAYERALQKRFEVCVLVAGDSDYLPLVRKLSGLGVRVLLLGGNFEYRDRAARSRTAKTSLALATEVDYRISLDKVAEPGSLGEGAESLVEGLFGFDASPPAVRQAAGASPLEGSPSWDSGTIESLIERESEGKRYGFIAPECGDQNLWFGERDLEGVEFSALTRGQTVRFKRGVNGKGACAKRVHLAP